MEGFDPQNPLNPLAESGSRQDSHPGKGHDKEVSEVRWMNAGAVVWGQGRGEGGISTCGKSAATSRHSFHLSNVIISIQAGVDCI